MAGRIIISKEVHHDEELFSRNPDHHSLVPCCGGMCKLLQRCSATGSSVATPWKPTHEEVRRKHIAQAREKLTRCKERLDNMQAEVEVYGPGQDSPRYAVKAEDMPRLRYIVSQLQANPEFVPMRVSMRHSRRLHCLNLDFGEGVKLSLRVEYITNPGRSDTSHKRSLYALPNAELRRELIGIIERALLPKK